MKIFSLILIFSFSILSSRAQLNEWTWVSGDTASSYPVFGVQGVYSPSNHPDARYSSIGWVDKQGHFWYYSTNGYLWEYNPSIDQWRYVWGAPAGLPVYGIKGVPAATNSPGVRDFGCCTWTDTTGYLWLFGGTFGNMYCDLWRYDIVSGMWTWMSGSNIQGNLGVYGTMGVPSVLNYPVGRAEINTCWVDSVSNSLWLYGGQSGNTWKATGDLWKYDVGTNEWTWMLGDTLVSSMAVYGTRFVADPLNTPGRRYSYCKWTDLSGNFYLFAGSLDFNATKNDTWKYDPGINQWTWLSGSSGFFAPGVANGYCQSDTMNTPGNTFENKICWTDRCGNGWAFSAGYNNLWMFQSATAKWTLVGGSANSNLPGSYGIKGVSSPSNYPVGMNATPGWIGKDGAMYFMNQAINSVMWKYVPDTACSSCIYFPAASFTSLNEICPGSCIDFTSTSMNAAAYQWDFPGGIPATSSGMNPGNICYNAPGNYDVQLIVSNSMGSDTLLLNNYITVFPYPSPQGINLSGDTLYAFAGAYAYQWYYEGSIIPGATDYFYPVTQSGDYNVVATDTNGCEVEAAIVNVIAGLTGNLSPYIGFFVFPNPVNSEMSVNRYLLSVTSDEFLIFNLLGQQVMTLQSQTENSSHVATLDVRTLPPGIYWLETGSGNNILRAKFVKE